jgi:hypothetical protein
LSLGDSLDGKSTIVRDLRHLDVNPRCVCSSVMFARVAKRRDDSLYHLYKLFTIRRLHDVCKRAVPTPAIAGCLVAYLIVSTSIILGSTCSDSLFHHPDCLH